MRRLACVFGALLLMLRVAAAADVPVVFDDPARQVRYESLLEELRCLVCQNQSLADSHAELAQDMRDEVYRRVNSGESNTAIANFLVARYGDFVLYRPPVKRSTWLLWGGPFVLLTLAVAVIIRISRRASAEARPLTDEERTRLEALINDDSSAQP